MDDGSNEVQTIELDSQPNPSIEMKMPEIVRTTGKTVGDAAEDGGEDADFEPFAGRDNEPP